MSSTTEYRDRIIREDILLKLMEYRELNQTALLSYCGLNSQKHKSLLDKMESKGLISKSEEFRGKKKVLIYWITEARVAFCKRILQPYEAMFPRITGKSSTVT